ncbi:conserved hypothetical protein [Paraburkholderia ribeironis]|uniref:Uncharacterized protein n=1 Tax=Paraburkholderia ribeironis TaxID=1247936 RepID=A0A1N7SPH5_9BURK|nr:hypothetical protein [Paraburkholderia ribeironis]SIT49351.1 conserved hypothetical protein [Paraburkholderia ribeironis]
MQDQFTQPAFPGNARGTVIDNLDLLDSLAALAAESAVPVCATVDSRILPLALQPQVTESHIVAIAIPHEMELDWDAQTTDQLFPHNEVDYEHRQATTLILLGDGPIAFEPSLVWKPLFGTDGSLFVVFLHRGKTLLIRYRWNERFLATIDSLNASAGDNHKHDDEMAARAIIVMRSPTYGSADSSALVPAAYFDVETDGSLSEYQPSERLRSEPDKVTNPCPLEDY